jgi:glycosyltransferase involved in cell wall biosynthesis
MNIWQISADFPPNTGGVASHVHELSKALGAIGHKCTVFTTVSKNHDCEKSNISRVKRFKIPRFQPFYDIFFARILKKQLASDSPDIIHVHGMRPLIASKHLNVPVVFTNHTSGFLKRIPKGAREIKKVRKRMNHISHVLAPSIELIEATKKVGYKGDTTYIPNGVDPMRFTPDGPNLRSNFNIEANEFVVLVARRLVPKNGVLDFAQSTSFLKNRNFKILIAGDGSERDSIVGELKRSGMFDRTIFLGNVSNTEMPNIYRSANLSILPSHMEATSITGLESISCGLPLVGTRVGGIPEIIKNGKNGFLIEKRSPEQLASAIDRCFENKDLLAGFSNYSLELSKNFVWDVIARQTSAVYSKLL